MIDPLSDAKVIDSWQRNAAPWSTAIREQQIESRRLVTDRAVLETAMALNPRSAIDLGCGEGWLSRALASRGVDIIGVDVVPALVETARTESGGVGDYRVASYEEIARGVLDARADVVVANFSLIGKDAVDALVGYVPSLLASGGHFIVQSLHPVSARGDFPYEDGWRPGSWSGFSDAFTDPAPWYFRTLESWVALLIDSGLRLRMLREPVHPVTGAPASLILVADVA
ncbi:MAG: methyltransferase domain-containing protein [Gemmatimonadaceae bacterium]